MSTFLATVFPGGRPVSMSDSPSVIVSEPLKAEAASLAETLMMTDSEHLQLKLEARRREGARTLLEARPLGATGELLRAFSKRRAPVGLAVAMLAVVSGSITLVAASLWLSNHRVPVEAAVIVPPSPLVPVELIPAPVQPPSVAAPVRAATAAAPRPSRRVPSASSPRAVPAPVESAPDADPLARRE